MFIHPLHDGYQWHISENWMFVVTTLASHKHNILHTQCESGEHHQFYTFILYFQCLPPSRGGSSRSQFNPLTPNNNICWRYLKSPSPWITTHVAYQSFLKMHQYLWLMEYSWSGKFHHPSAHALLLTFCYPISPPLAYPSLLPLPY